MSERHEETMIFLNRVKAICAMYRARAKEYGLTPVETEADIDVIIKRLVDEECDRRQGL